MEEINIKCKEIEFIDSDLLFEHPKNNSIHPKNEDLITRLRKIIRSPQGFNLPLKVNSNKKVNKLIAKRENKYVISSGHARLEALKAEGVKKIPCIKIDYENEDYLLADLIADNATNDWREVNKSAVNSLLPDLGDINFDIDLTGIENFTIEVMEKVVPLKDDEINKSVKESVKTCPSCGYEF